MTEYRDSGGGRLLLEGTLLLTDTDTDTDTDSVDGTVVDRVHLVDARSAKPVRADDAGQRMVLPFGDERRKLSAVSRASAGGRPEQHPRGPLRSRARLGEGCRPARSGDRFPRRGHF
ncbi:hypothetical protein [Streptomyces sp. NPDC046925]|uniref:hypothetical protein n=1 Tax=Streptomyces sp. NPDC046925 TaxID=3155375 RepID=UPI0033C5109C